jgi:two-component system chemotaxis sensor kinase CheA
MFKSLIPKLNLSVNACLNYDKLKKSNYLLKKQKEELIKANKIKDDFLANMSHELKTPLNSISIISAIMSQNKNNKLDSSSHKNIKIINKCAEDLTELINDILDISKIEAGELTINKNNISLKDLIEDLYDLFKPIAQNKNIEFINNFQIDNIDIFTDEHRTKQIIKNLVDNAIKFTNKGKVEILSKEFEDYFEISIIDSGSGIGKENLNYIFDRFKQVDNSISKKHHGAGLGLAISKQLANLLNGYISATSEMGVGSIFKYIIYKKSNEISSQNNNEAEIDTKESIKSIFLFNKVFLTKQIYLFHSNSIEQLNLTITLKKYGLNVIPILNEKKLKEKTKDIKNNNHLIILDSKIENLKNIINDENLIKLNLMILEERETIENLIENLKSIQLFNKGNNNE